MTIEQTQPRLPIRTRVHGITRGDAVREFPCDVRMMSRTRSRWQCWRELLALLAHRCSAQALVVVVVPAQETESIR